MSLATAVSSAESLGNDRRALVMNISDAEEAALAAVADQIGIVFSLNTSELHKNDVLVFVIHEEDVELADDLSAVFGLDRDLVGQVQSGTKTISVSRQYTFKENLTFIHLISRSRMNDLGFDCRISTLVNVLKNQKERAFAELVACGQEKSNG